MSLNTTLCYLEQGGSYLMLHRIKKQNDLNHDKWVGVGGKFEKDESPEECLLREVYEETGLTLTQYRWRGVITFVSDAWETEYMYLYTATAWQGALPEEDSCREGRLEWVAKTDVPQLPIWEGDKIFFRLLAQDAPPFSLKMVYKGDTLTFAALNGEPLPVGKEN
jgi:8-oxo-dGTP diphosphatase